LNKSGSICRDKSVKRNHTGATTDMPQFLCAACIDAADYGIVQVSTWWRLLSRLVQFMHPSWAHPDNTLGCTACAVSISARSKRPVVVHIGATMLCRVLFVVQGSHIYIYIYITVIRPKKPFVQTLDPGRISENCQRLARCFGSKLSPLSCTSSVVHQPCLCANPGQKRISERRKGNDWHS